MPSYTSGSVAVGYPVSGDYRIAALQGDFNDGQHRVWLPLNLTYSFPAGNALWDGGLNYANNEIRAGWFPLSAAQQANVKQALDAWSAVSAITFTPVAETGASVGDLRFGFTYAITGSTAAWAYSPVDGSAAAGDVWIKGSSYTQLFAPSVNAYGSYNQQSANNFHTLVHEIGHALGLSHPFAKAGETRYTAPLGATEDHYNNTVMSYSRFQDPYGGIPSTPMPYDILAIQYLYGSNFFYNTGNTNYTYDINDIQLLTLWDAGGEDTITVTNNSNIREPNGTTKRAYIDLREGQGSAIGFSSQYWASLLTENNGYIYRNGNANIYIAYGCVIENAVTGEGSDTLIGNAARNKFTSGSGSDTIDGGAGIDTSIYSLAKSSYTLAKTSAGWTVKDNFLTGTVFSYTDTLTNIERLQFSNVSVALDLTGNAGTTAKILGAVFSKAEVANKAYVGIGLGLLDGGMSYPDLMQAAINAKLGAGATHAAVVNLLYTNLVGSAPGAADLAYYVGLLDSQAMTQASLGVVAADHALNQANINLVGLTSSGIEYV